jgi:hypothetical protein
LYVDDMHAHMVLESDGHLWSFVVWYLVDAVWRSISRFRDECMIKSVKWLGKNKPKSH